MKAILVYRALTREEISSVQGAVSNGARLFAGRVEDLPVELSAAGVEPIILNNEVKHKATHETIEDIVSFGDLKLNGTTYKDFLCIEESCLWHYYKFRMLFALREEVFNNLEIEQYADEFAELDVYCSKKPDLAGRDHIKIHLKKTAGQGLNPLSIFRYMLIFLYRGIVGWFQHVFMGRRKQHLILTSPRAESAYLNFETKEDDVDDIFLGYLLQQIDGSFVCLDNVHVPKIKSKYSFRITSRMLFNPKGRPQLYGEFILLRGLFSVFGWRKLIGLSRSLKAVYGELSSEANIPSHRYLIKSLKSLHSSSIYFAFRFLAYKQYFRMRPYKTVTAQDETAASTKIILDAARSQGIVTVGIQHGAISALNVNYRFTEDDQRLHPAPDYTLVWGEHWKDIAIKYGNYSPDSLIVAGQIRTDIIPSLIQHGKSEGESTPSKTMSVVFATQAQPDEELRKMAAEDAFRAIEDIPNANLIIKLHPRESGAEYYHSIAKTVGCTNYSVDGTSDLYKVIAEGDVLMTCFSVVGQEAVYFNKPLIILDHLELDFCGYYEEKVAFRATNAEQLRDLFSQLMDGSLSVNTDAYSEFIRKYAFKVDGKVAERCLEFIKSR